MRAALSSPIPTALMCKANLPALPVNLPVASEGKKAACWAGLGC